MAKLSNFEAYLLAVVAMDRDYEHLGTLWPFMSARFGRKGNPRAVVRALKSLESKGLVTAYRYVPKGRRDSYVRQSISLLPKDLLAQNAWYRATREGFASWKRLAIRAI